MRAHEYKIICAIGDQENNSFAFSSFVFDGCVTCTNTSASVVYAVLGTRLGSEILSSAKVCKAVASE